jgi:hypothetical protein
MHGWSLLRLLLCKNLLRTNSPLSFRNIGGDAQLAMSALLVSFQYQNKKIANKMNMHLTGSSVM